MRADRRTTAEEELQDLGDIESLSSRPRSVPQHRVNFRSSARLCRRAGEASRRRGFSSLTMWLRTMMWQLVSEVEEE